MKHFAFICFFCFSISHGTAQDSTPMKKFSASITERFAETRMFDFEYQGLSSRTIKPILLEAKHSKMKVNHHSGFKTSINIPVLKGNKWQLTYSLLYHYQGMELTTANQPLNEVDLHYVKSTATYSHFTSIFGKLLVLNGSLILDGSQKNFERLKPMASAFLVLKKTEDVRMSVGIIGVFDPTSRTPVFPIVTYTRNLENNWRLDFIFPQRILLQTRLLRNGRFSVGTELNGSSFYIRSRNIVDFANKFEFRQTELRTGASYEYLLNKSIVLSAKAGILNPISARLSERGQPFHDDQYLMNLKSGASGYVNLGISFNPF